MITVILLHGGVSSHAMWDAFVPFMRRITVSTLDMRGHGRSGFYDDRGISYPLLADDLAQVHPVVAWNWESRTSSDTRPAATSHWSLECAIPITPPRSRLALPDFALTQRCVRQSNGISASSNLVSWISTLSGRPWDLPLRNGS
ncbi:MAG: hypothetical protein R2851_05855 [Caldilineaceae bacterium]